uniref:CSON006848 protein n=1 Tax=Culicoides sonorensis TaxID=179676 RepID=A0A336MZA8_CULSO
MSKGTVQLLFFKIFILCHMLNAYSANPLMKRKSLPVPPAELFTFFRNFGYLDPAPGDSEALYSENAIVDAIKSMQKFGGLEQTGELNDETLNLLITPRCGRSDISPNAARNKRFVIGGLGWRKQNVTYFIANWSPKIGTEEKIASDLRKAFDVWSHYSYLKFTRVYKQEEGDIIISFGARYHGDNYPFDGPGYILAHAFYPYEDPSYGGDVHFDNDENWVEGAQTLHEGVDFLSVAIHELGHSLGLAHSYDPEAVMFPYYRGGTSGHSLQYDDILGLYELYVKNPITSNTDSNASDLDQTTYIHKSDKTTESPSSIPSTTTTRYASRRKNKVRTTKMPVVEASTTEIIITTTDKPMLTFEGDYETIEKHKERFTVTPSLVNDFTQDSQTLEESPPDICLGKFDAVSVIRNEIFFFKGSYVWRLSSTLKLMEGYPIPWKEVFPGFPDYIKTIDAIYERDNDSAIVFFTGNMFWVHDGDQLIENSPQPFSRYGIPSNVVKIDAVMIWAKNNKTYLFSQDQFWRYDENKAKLDYGYPMTMDRWYGIPSNLDATLTLINGKTYFFKNNKYWLFNNHWVRPEKTYPRRASKAWFNC